MDWPIAIGGRDFVIRVTAQIDLDASWVVGGMVPDAWPGGLGQTRPSPFTHVTLTAVPVLELRFVHDVERLFFHGSFEGHP